MYAHTTASTPRFSRLGLKGAGVVMPVSVKDVEKARRRQSAVSVMAILPESDNKSVKSKGSQRSLISLASAHKEEKHHKEKEREKEMAALVAGTIDAHDAKKSKRKRRTAAAQRLDLAGEGADVVIANEPRTNKKKEQPWQKELRHARYAAAL